ncbi:adenosyl-hopene transferase HpnH [Pseudonocardia sp. WMMC193]|uniref:adenosyl-hopene transferase HpnH n=1 Tax=Pseudonocardia sp. WMMC193 TaxID=2911965 RepID=UPI001EFF9856|nr:adenosyl-hopene transferase HpnH [Pseudonocardia sp. WMMC193]MCF7549177.1 adenosyl-hopene transferase HpnH [Pseudonocardia sp. WMMC193]
MGMPMRQSIRLGTYLMKQKIKRVDKFPLLVELEPLFACNLKCNGCGKIQQPAHLLKQRMPVEQAVNAIVESGAPMVSIAGGEPLMHKEMDVIVQRLLDLNKIVFLCTNAVLLPKHLHRFTPHKNFAWMVHIDGLRERHDESVSKEGVFDQAVEAIRMAKEAGFRVNTNTTFFDTDTPQDVIDVLDYLNDELGVDLMQISPGYAYEKAPDQEHFLGVQQTRELFKKAFGDGRRKKWRLNHSPVFLDFLEGKVDLDCTAWAIPSYSLLGWQKPCYLLDDGHVKTYRELVEGTDWEAYGRGKDERCANCMAHCGYEPSAVMATMGSLRESIRAAVSV